MSGKPAAIGQFQHGLEPYIKPREQINYIRRVLAVYLGSCSHGGTVQLPLSLADASYEVDQGSELKGLYRQYIEALTANIAARQQFEETRGTSAEEETNVSRSARHASGDLEEHLHLVRVRQKRERLLAIRRYLDILTEKPASSDGFLSAKEIFREGKALPHVPREVVEGLVNEHGTSQLDLDSRVAQLEKTVLRAKLQLKKQASLLQDTKAKSRAMSTVLSNATRFRALHAVRDELIGWIETELDKAPAEEHQQQEVDVEEVARNDQDLEGDQRHIAAQLETIKRKYAGYVECRRDLLALVTQKSDIPPKPLLQPKPQVQRNESTPAPSPVDHLITPYIETLLSISRTQKAMIAQKSHTKALLSRHNGESYQALGHLAEESQLLPTYPMKESLRRRSGLWSELTAQSSEKPDLANRIRPWVFAADSAKIATLEAVAETVESGQIALENSMRALQDVDRMLGHGGDMEDPADESSMANETEDDVWLRTEYGRSGIPRKQTEQSRKRALSQKDHDIWSTLHGTLGLIGQED